MRVPFTFSKKGGGGRGGERMDGDAKWISLEMVACC